MKKPLLALCVLAGLSGWSGSAEAVCKLPYVLNNGTITDAVKVMADLNALAACQPTGVGPCSASAPGTIPATGGDPTFFLSADCTFKAVPAAPPGCSATLAGLVPATGGGTTNFLRADCVFAAVPSAPPGCSTSVAGLLPPTGGGSLNFLRADCVFVPLTCANLPGDDCPWDPHTFMPGVPANSAIIRYAVVRAATCPAGFSGAKGLAKTASTGTATVTVNQITAGVTTARGTMTFTASATGVPASGSGMSLAVGDMVELAYPSSADATLADIAITLKCARA